MTDTETHYELHIKLDEYAGNHEREFVWWLFGFEDFDVGVREEDKELLSRNHADKLKWWNSDDGMEPAFRGFYDEYGYSFFRLDYRDSNTIVMELSEVPPLEDWNALIEACAGGYAPPHRSYYKEKPRRINILSVKLLQVTTHRAVVSYKFN